MRTAATHILLIALCALASLGAASVAQADDAETQRLLKIKAAFILNFAKYTTWPGDAFEKDDSPLVVTVVGPETMGLVLDVTLRDQKIDRHPIHVRRPLRPSPPRYGASPGEVQHYEEQIEAYYALLRQSHMLVVTEPNEAYANESLRQGTNGLQLTVGDVSGFAERGGMIGLVQRDGKMAFDVNPTRINRSRLAVSSKILALGRVVKDKE